MLLKLSTEWIDVAISKAVLAARISSIMHEKIFLHHTEDVFMPHPLVEY